MEGSTSHRPRLSWLSSLLVCLFALPATAGGALAADPTPSLPYARAAYYAGAGAPYDPITRLDRTEPALNPAERGDAQMGRNIPPYPVERQPIPTEVAPVTTTGLTPSRSHATRQKSVTRGASKEDFDPVEHQICSKFEQMAAQGTSPASIIQRQPSAGVARPEKSHQGDAIHGPRLGHCRGHARTLIGLPTPLGLKWGTLGTGCCYAAPKGPAT